MAEAPVSTAETGRGNPGRFLGWPQACGSIKNGSKARPAYRYDIDGLRAIAVAVVVIFHAFPTLLPGGFVGVDIFFVISGYLIGSILLGQLHEDAFSFRDFYARRIKRIFPAVLLVLIACYGVGWFNLIDTEYQELGKHIAAGAVFLSNFALWHEAGYFDVSAETKPLLHLWSLGVEEQFYVFWPLILWGMRKLRINPLLAIVCVGMASFALNLATVGTDPTADFYSPLTRFWELMIGCGLAYQHVLGSKLRYYPANLMGWVGAILITASVVWFRGQDRFPGWEALLPTVGAVLLLAAGADGWVNRHLLQARPLVQIGLISFPLYLWHWPLLVFGRIWLGDTPAWTARLLIVLASVVLAWLTFRAVEVPVRFGQRRPWMVAALVLLMSAVGLQGFNTYRRDGLAFRLNAMATQFASVQKDLGPSWRAHVCYLSGKERASLFQASCTDSGSEPLVFLWGDSHAAALYPGLRNLQRQYVFRLAEYTVASCAPLLGEAATDARCGEIQRQVFEKLKAARPKLAIVTAEWKLDNVQKIGSTVAALRNAGVENIVIVGPTPAWRDALPKVYWLYWRKFHQVLPARTRFDLRPEGVEIDRQAQAIAAQWHVPYVSAYQTLCDDRGCETRTGPGKGQMTMFDFGHLTSSGSIALMDAAAPALFGTTILLRVKLAFGLSENTLFGG